MKIAHRNFPFIQVFAYSFHVFLKKRVPKMIGKHQLG